MVRLRPRDSRALLDTAPPCSAVVCKLSSDVPSPLLSRLRALFAAASSPHALAALYSKLSAAWPDFVLTSNSYPPPLAATPPRPTTPTHLHPTLTTHRPRLAAISLLSEELPDENGVVNGAGEEGVAWPLQQAKRVRE